MANVFNVAKYILERQGTLTTWQLQKLCYYSQAWALAWTSKPLFNERFEAWANGPVCPDLYSVHRGQYYVSAGNFEPSSNVLTPDEKETIDVVLEHYGNWEPYKLREQTHIEDPWKNARGGIPDMASSNAVITQEAMASYYGSL